MTTVTIQIGNSDNKLTQGEWAHFCEYIRGAISQNVYRIYFQGGSDWDAPWQNACWVCEVSPDQVEKLKQELTRWRTAFKQDSVAITFGETEFV